MQTEKSGVLLAIGSYILWGILPVYWKHLDHVSSSEIMASRVVWAFISTLLLVIILKGGRHLLADIKTLWKAKRAFWSLFFASILVTSNWFLYVWAVNNNYLVQTSLGYYINPLVSVLLGVFFLKRKAFQSPANSLFTCGIWSYNFNRFVWKISGGWHLLLPSLLRFMDL